MKQNYIAKFAFGVLTGSGIGIISTSILIFALAFVLSVANVPATLISPATVILIAIGSFIGGLFCAGIYGEKGMICGLFSGLMFFLVLWLCGGIFGFGGSGTAAIIKFFMITISSCLGGIIGVNYIKRK